MSTSTPTTTISNCSSVKKVLTTSTRRVDDASEYVKKDASELECGRERLKRHRVEVAGRVWIPDIWGQEDLLKDWIDCSVFDASLAPKGVMSAREALANQQHQRRSSPAAATSGLEVGTASC